VLALSVLTLINLFNYLDRYVVAAVLPDLQGEAMGLSGAQAGLLGTAFMVVYTVAAPAFGVLGDRGSRTRAIAVGVFLWSLATILSGFAANYAHLLGARALVGIGEAAYVTIAPALLADSFSRAQRGRVLSVFNMAIPVGSALGYIVGGLVSHHYGWRAAFFIAGAPGLLLSVWVLGLKDPPRGSRDEPDTKSPIARPATAPTAKTNPLAVYWSLLRQRPYRVVVLGYAAYTFALGGLAYWMPTFLVKVRGIPQAQATTGFGAIVVVTGFLGTFVGGWLGDYWLKFSREAYLWMSGWITLLAVPFAFLALTAASPSVYYPAIVVAELLLFMSTGPVNTAIVNLVSPLQRASAVALSMFTIHFLGDVPSPLLIGWLSDAFSLAKAVLVVPAAVAVSGIIWLLSARVCAAIPAAAAAETAAPTS
jgi:MFS family permease